jgi:hypothetical protein
MKFITKNISHYFTYMSGISPYAKHWEKLEDTKGIIILRIPAPLVAPVVLL